MMLTDSVKRNSFQSYRLKVSQSFSIIAGTHVFKGFLQLFITCAFVQYVLKKGRCYPLLVFVALWCRFGQGAEAVPGKQVRIIIRWWSLLKPQREAPVRSQGLAERGALTAPPGLPCAFLGARLPCSLLRASCRRCKHCLVKAVGYFLDLIIKTVSLAVCCWVLKAKYIDTPS